MSDENEHGEAAPVEPADVPRPADPVERRLAPVAEAMEPVRRGASTSAADTAVPTDDEVAALEHAHEVLRSTLDRVDRGG